MPFEFAGKRVWVAGHTGMVGSALVRRLSAERCEVLTADRSEVELRDPAAVQHWVSARSPHAVFVAAGTVGGIMANSLRPVDFLSDNLLIAVNVIGACHQSRVEKLVYLGSSCIYPRLAPQPISEDALLTGPLEPTNEWYAVAKIAGLKLCQAYRRQYGSDFVSAMPTNLYGPGDTYDTEAGHVLPALIRRFHEAKAARAQSVVVWGSGRPLREFMYVDDVADACVFLARTYSGEEPVNVGTGEEISIGDLARLVAAIVGFAGEIRFDPTKPDGTPRKLLDSGKLTRMGWKPAHSLREGVQFTYRAFLSECEASAGSVHSVAAA